MSELKVTNLSHPSAGAAAITLAADGTVTLPGFGGGIGSNVVSTTLTSTFTTASSTFTDVTGLTATITPSSASAKVLVLVSLSFANTNVGVGAFGRLMRDSTPIAVGDAEGSRLQSSFVAIQAGATYEQFAPVHLVTLDAPATTSPVAYHVEVRRGITTGTVVVNRDGNNADNANTPRLVSSITVIEVSV